MSTQRAALAWFRAWGRTGRFTFAAAAAALSLSAYTARTRALAMKHVYFDAWHVLPGFTLFAALLLYIFGTGPVRGFAVTLSIGLLTSMFTAVMVTRLMVVTWYARRRPKVLPL